VSGGAVGGDAKFFFFVSLFGPFDTPDDEKHVKTEY